MPDTPLVLAFDTAFAHCAVALYRGDQKLLSRTEPMAKGQAERLMGLCQDLIADSGNAFSDLDLIGVGIGPGNFTGIRIAVSAARGLALGLGVPAIGVSAFDALRAGTDGPCACAVDARRDQVYLQIFDGTDVTAPAIHAANALPPFDGPLLGIGGRAPALPVADAIAICASRALAATTARPAPLYLRPADAAPARDAPPRILA